MNPSIFASYRQRIFEPSGGSSNVPWILSTGTWNDDQFWRDDGVWNDGASLLDSQSWNDSNFFNDETQLDL